MSRLIDQVKHFFSFYSEKWDGPKYYIPKKTFDSPRKLSPVNARDDLSAVLGLLHDERVFDLNYAENFLHLSDFSSFPEYINSLVKKGKIRLELWIFPQNSQRPIEKFKLSKYSPSKDEDRKVYAFFKDN